MSGSIKNFAKKAKRRIKSNSLFTKYFCAFLVLEFFCFAVLGVAFGFFAFGNWSEQALELLSENSENVASLTSEILATRMDTDARGSIFLLCNNINLISNSIDADIFVCNTEGDIILCKDLVSEDYTVSENGECLVHSLYHVPDSVLKSALEGGFSSSKTKLDGMYVKYQLASVRPVTVNGNAVAAVFAVKPVSSGAFTYYKNIIKMFLLSASFALIVGAVAIYFFTGNLIRPLRDMSKATKAYAMGDFSYRVKVRGGGELENLLKAFNSMASSLASLENSRRSFVANVSHELKTPMTTIGGFIDGILDGTIPPENQSYYLEIVSNETKRLSRLVVAMLNMSKIEAGELKLKPKKFNICNDIFNVFISFEQKIEEKNIEICGLDVLEPTYVTADEDMIHQVIYNLVDNAVKFTENGKITAFVNKNENKSVSVIIRNTGAGIQTEELSKIFERFYKVDKSRSYDVKGAGLGLYIVKTIVEMHGGTVQADSREGEYTEFRITLPEFPPLG